MSQSWLFEVLDDLIDYARRNRFTRLAHQLEIAQKVAREEMGSPPGGSSGDGDPDPSDNGATGPA